MSHTRTSITVLAVLALAALFSLLAPLTSAEAASSSDFSAQANNRYCFLSPAEAALALSGRFSAEGCDVIWERDFASHAQKLAAVVQPEIPTLWISPTADGVSLRAEPQTNSLILGVARIGQVIEVTEAYQPAAAKVGVSGQWLRVRMTDGREAFTAAWLYTAANSIVMEAHPAPVLPSSPGRVVMDVSTGDRLYLAPTVNRLRIRSAPVNGDVVAVTSVGELVEAIDSAPVVAAKIGVNGEWIRVRTQDGLEGYSAAWLYRLAEQVPAGTVTPSPAPAARSETAHGLKSAARLYLTPKGDEIRIRTAPVDGRVIDLASQGEFVEVVEPIDSALAKVGVNGEWIEVRTQDGGQGYTAAWLYRVAEPEAAAAPVSADPAPASTESEAPLPVVTSGQHLFLAPKGDEIRIRTAPVDGRVIGLASQGELVEVIEPLENAAPKVGVNNEWIQVRTTDGIQGWTAAWLYKSSAPESPTPPKADDAASVPAAAPAVVEPAPASVPTVTAPGMDLLNNPSAARLYLTPQNNAIRIRMAPVDGRVIGLVSQGEVLEVIEPVTSAAPKVGADGEWIHVRTPDGIEGWTAAWLYKATEPLPAAAVAPEAGSTSDPAAPNASTEEPEITADATLILAPTGNAIRVREQPVDGTVLATIGVDDRVEVLESADVAAAKVGVNGEWLQVRTPDGVEGYTAAWLYTIAEVIRPAPRVDVIPPLDTSEVPGLTDVAPLDGLAALGPESESSANSITSLGLLPEVDHSSTVIPSLSSSIVSLGVPDGPVGFEAAAAAADDSAAQPSMTTDSPPVSAPVVAPPEAAAAPAQAGPGSQPQQLVGNVVPISITVSDKTEVELADLSINGRRLAVFTAPPYQFDLDTTLLTEGDYKLTFSMMASNGVVQSGDLFFQVALQSEPAPALSSEGAADGASVSAAPAVPAAAVSAEEAPGAASASSLVAPDGRTALDSSQARRVLLINGEVRPFTLEFSTEKGLVPVTPVVETTSAAPAETEAPKSLKDILSKPFSSLIPEPVRAELMVQRPTLAAVIILLMLLTLLPQGFLTLYWMTYTWNNPEVAEAYRSPKEFVAPQHSFTALVPARHEARVIKDTIRAIDRINYPEHLKEILVLIRDEDDDETIAAAREAIWEIGKDNIRLITFNDGPRNKPNGLNKGLRAATKDVVTVFDAEDEPHPDIYNVINTVMVRDGSDVVQSGVQLMNYRSSWFSVFTVLEYFFWFKSGLHAYTRKFGVTPLGGNTVFFKRYWLERAGGWDDQCLTEDADIGIRLTQMGAKIQIVYDEQHATQEETPDSVDSFIKQRTRWNHGFYQIFFKGDWRKLPMLKQKLVALYILLNSLLQAAMIFYIPVGLYIATTQRVSVPLALLSYIPIYILVLQLVTNLVGIREFTSAYGERMPLGFTFKMILFYYPYQLLLSVAAMRAVYRLLLQKQSWEKTAHSNLHRQGQPSQVGV